MDGYQSCATLRRTYIACETRSEPPPSPASLAVGSTPRAKITLHQPFSRTNAFYYSFVPHTVSITVNSLSYSQVAADSLASFKQLI